MNKTASKRKRRKTTKQYLPSLRGVTLKSPLLWVVILVVIGLGYVILSSHAATTTGWTRIYRNDFTDLNDVARYETTAKQNDTIGVKDTNNKLLQWPRLRSNVSVVPDSAADGGTALVVCTCQGTYPTSAGPQTGWISAGMNVNQLGPAPPVRVRTRIKMTPSIGAKSAVMWWPSKGWPWEVDFAETFGGKTMTDFWGGRQHVSQNWHAGGKPQLPSHSDTVDMTTYHIFDLFILPDHMWVEIDGVKTFETYDKKWIPTTSGFFTVGKALTGERDYTHTTDKVFVDWVEIYRGSGSPTSPTPTVTHSPQPSTHPTTTPAPTPKTPLPTPFDTGSSDNGGDTVSGVLDLPAAPPGGSVSYQVDGKPIAGTNLDTSTLSDGSHIIDGTITASNGTTQPFHEVVNVENQKSPWSQVLGWSGRNWPVPVLILLGLGGLGWYGVWRYRRTGRTPSRW